MQNMPTNDTRDLATYFSFKDLELRHAQDADIDQLVEIINEAYSYQDEAKGEPRTSAAKLHARIKEVEFYVLVRDGALIGCVYLESKATMLHFGLLTLTKENRGLQIGSVLVEAIENFAVENGYSGLELDYMSLAPWLKTYYERYGFELTGEVTEWGTINLIRMSKSLR